MTIHKAIGRQLRHPTGPIGWAIGYVMGLLNARPNSLTIATLQLHPDDVILELGCGPGHAIGLLAANLPNGLIHAVDQSTAMLAQARWKNRKAIKLNRVRLYQSRFEALPLPSHSVDKILAVNVAYFWSDPQQVLREARRVLRPGGTMAVYVTAASTMRRWRFADADTHRLFDADGLIAMLRQSDFRDDPVALTSTRVIGEIVGLIATVGNRHAASLLAPQNMPPSFTQAETAGGEARRNLSRVLYDHKREVAVLLRPNELRRADGRLLWHS